MLSTGVDSLLGFYSFFSKSKSNYILNNVIMSFIFFCWIIFLVVFLGCYIFLFILVFFLFTVFFLF